MKTEQVLKILDENGVCYELAEHPAAYTIEDIEKMNLPYFQDICKNLFLRDAKGRRHFLVSLCNDKRADLVALQAQLGCSKLSFASEERLWNYLKLQKGAVTPLGILNDTDHAVEVVFDSDLAGKQRVGVHPCENTATVWISYNDLLRLIRKNGNTVSIVHL